MQPRIAAIYNEGIADRIATFETSALGRTNCRVVQPGGSL